jgi:hypothetical protein
LVNAIGVAGQAVESHLLEALRSTIQERLADLHTVEVNLPEAA